MIMGFRFLSEVMGKRFSDFDKEYLKERMHALLFEWTFVPLCLVTLSVFLLNGDMGSRQLESPAWRDYVLVLFLFLLLTECASYGFLKRVILDSGRLEKAARASDEPALGRFVSLFVLFSTQPLTAQALALVHYLLFSSLLHFSLLCAASVAIAFWTRTLLDGFYGTMDELYCAEIGRNQKDL